MNELVIYNSMTRKKEVFVPRVPGKVSMYVCGPTVYDYIHIGNARPAIFFDVVRRFLSRHYEVSFVMNFTDVDDKLIKKSLETGKSVPEITEKFIQAYFEDAVSLSIKEADVHPRVTENINEIILFIASLIEKGFAYEKNGDVYFRTERFDEYGKLSGQLLEELQHGSRIDVNENKEDVRDFVLWKRAKDGEIQWDSAWGPGRPGWHIECSTMIKKYLGETIDIHGGGSDLQFPHHECEIAQSESLHGTPLANYWMHNGYIHINEQKMSKSLGNSITVRELTQKVKPEALRYAILSIHYRHPLHFSDEVLVQAENSITRLNNTKINLEHRLPGADQEETAGNKEFEQQLEAFEQQFNQKMCDDFNTADALTVWFELANVLNPYLQQDRVHRTVITKAIEMFRSWDEILGILPEENVELPDQEVDQLMAEREEARANRQFSRADEIRDILQSRGIVLEDTPQGTRWRRK